MPSGLSATKKRPYYFHDTLQFMTPQIMKNKHQESNLLAQHTGEDTSLSGENEEDTQMNGRPNENVPLENITPLENPAVMQQASCQSNRDNCRQSLLGKGLTAIDPVDMCFIDYMKQQTQSKTPDPNEFLHSLLPDMKSMTAKQKCRFKIGAMKLMDEILEDTGSDQRSFMGLCSRSN
jgi:hypothetical protein